MVGTEESLRLDWRWGGVVLRKALGWRYTLLQSSGKRSEQGEEVGGFGADVEVGVGFGEGYGAVLFD